MNKKHETTSNDSSLARNGKICHDWKKKLLYYKLIIMNWMFYIQYLQYTT